MDSWGNIAFDALDIGDGSVQLPTYPTYGSSRHVPNSAIDIVQFTGVGQGLITYTLRLERVEYDALLAEFRTVPRASASLVVGDALGEWYLESVTDAILWRDGSVHCAVTFREQQ